MWRARKWPLRTSWARSRLPWHTPWARFAGELGHKEMDKAAAALTQPCLFQPQFARVVYRINAICFDVSSDTNPTVPVPITILPETCGTSPFQGTFTASSAHAITITAPASWPSRSTWEPAVSAFNGGIGPCTSPALRTRPRSGIWVANLSWTPSCRNFCQFPEEVFCLFSQMHFCKFFHTHFCRLHLFSMRPNT